MFSTDKPTIEEARGEHHTADIALCQRVSDDLTNHYPGHPWAIGADHEAGCLWIHLAYPDNRAAQAEEIRGPEFGIPGYLLHTGKLQNKYDFNKVMRAGGELLERYKLQRGAYRDGDWGKARENGIDMSNAVIKSRA